ncbi:hypothetical protein SDC9_149223 [bioreactor metagenome]|uniref:Uncharacterized protein n=1 Tax=bioreactor metagenome TaxID=1076179 RepID=A0A645EL07_9ZZZZ
MTLMMPSAWPYSPWRSACSRSTARMTGPVPSAGFMMRLPFLLCVLQPSSIWSRRRPNIACGCPMAWQPCLRSCRTNMHSEAVASMAGRLPVKVISVDACAFIARVCAGRWMPWAQPWWPMQRVCMVMRLAAPDGHLPRTRSPCSLMPMACWRIASGFRP